MDIPKLCGVAPALVTPVNADRAFQPRPYELLLERVYAAGVDGVYVCGQTGEGLQLPPSEGKRAVECAVGCTPTGKKVIAHIGAMSTAEAVELARHAARAGAHALSSLPPAGAYVFEEVRAYYECVATATDLPFLVYYFPSIAPVIRTLDQIFELCRIPNVVGLKFTDSDFFRLWALRRGGAVVFTSSGLPVLPPSSVYELWFIGSGGARPAGLVPPVLSGTAGTTAPLHAAGLTAGDVVGVTVEPAGGVQAPTTTPIVVLTLPA